MNKFIAYGASLSVAAVISMAGVVPSSAAETERCTEERTTEIVHPAITHSESEYSRKVIDVAAVDAVDPVPATYQTEFYWVHIIPARVESYFNGAWVRYTPTENNPWLPDWVQSAERKVIDVEGQPAVEEQGHYEQVIDQPAWTETVVIKEAWTEIIEHDAEYETVHHEAEYETKHVSTTWKKWTFGNGWMYKDFPVNANPHGWKFVKKNYDEVLVKEAWDEQVLVKEAWTEMIQHPAVTKEVHHEATYKNGDWIVDVPGKPAVEEQSHMEYQFERLHKQVNDYQWAFESPGEGWTKQGQTREVEMTPFIPGTPAVEEVSHIETVFSTDMPDGDGWALTGNTRTVTDAEEWIEEVTKVVDVDCPAKPEEPTDDPDDTPKSTPEEPADPKEGTPEDGEPVPNGETPQAKPKAASEDQVLPNTGGPELALGLAGLAALSSGALMMLRRRRGGTS